MYTYRYRRLADKTLEEAWLLLETYLYALQWLFSSSNNYVYKNFSPRRR